MRVRLATEKDHETVMAIQRENPDLMEVDPTMRPNGPVLIAEDDSGNPVGVAVGRRTVEAFLYLKRDASPFSKGRALLKLCEDGFPLIGELGYGELHLFTSLDGFDKVIKRLPGAHADERAHAWVDVSGR